MIYFDKTRVSLKVITSLCALILFTLNSFHPAYSQSVSDFERSYAHTMLKTVKNEIKKNFYDPVFRGVDIESRFKDADAKIEQAKSLGELNAILIQFSMQFDEPNTFFAPSSAYSITDYGWDWIMAGDKCFVTVVKSGSDAEAKGLRVGDQVLSIEGYKPTRETSWKIKYGFFIAVPHPKLTVQIQRAGNQPRWLEIQSQRLITTRIASEQEFYDKANKLIEELKSQKIEVTPDLMIWKLFSLSTEERIGDTLRKAKKYNSLIIDLRSCREALMNSFNNQGSQDSLNRLQEITGYLFDRDVKIADLKKRKDQKSILAKSRGEDGFKGKIVVIVDNETASTSEVFARIIQLEKRGMVIGDRTKGTTRLSSGYKYAIQTGFASASWYGLVIAEREVIMSDGQSLDGVGVIPDEMVLPTAEDMASKRDPVLARAAASLGVQLTSERAGSLLRKPNYTLWMK